MSRLLLIAGSARSGSVNVKLRDAARRAAQAAGATTSVLDLRELDLPLYDGDVEANTGVPAAAARLRDAIREHDGLVVVTPEYNGFPTPLLINAFDWLSRLPDGSKVTADKPVALLSASPGALGGLRAMNFLRAYLQMSFQMLVLPRQQALSKAGEAFAADGSLADAKMADAVAAVVQGLLKVAAR